MKYDARACQFNMDTGCVELLLRDGRKISIDSTGVEDALDVTMSQRAELDYLIYNCMSFSEKSSKLIAVSSTSKIAVWTLHKIWERLGCSSCLGRFLLYLHTTSYQAVGIYARGPTEVDDDITFRRVMKDSRFSMKKVGRSADTTSCFFQTQE